jgi:hypothetical protein
MSWTPPPYGVLRPVLTYGITDATVVPEKPADVQVIEPSQPPPMMTLVHQLQRATSAADVLICEPQTQTLLVRVAAIDPVVCRAMPR